MKVGIITQPLIINYGGILQNYAMQQVLKRSGHTAITLNYMPSLSFGRYILYVGKAIVCVPFPSLRHAIKPYKHFRERPIQTKSFVANNISITKPIPKFTRHLLKKNRIDAILLGSDQVWRYKFSHYYWEDMFLAFAKHYHCRKIAYGASFGVEEWDCPQELKIKARKLVKQFDYVSVREDSGMDICRRELGVEAVTVLDPTLLLNAKDYEQFCYPSNPNESPYLAAYVLDMNDEKSEYIRTFAEKKGLKVKLMTISDNKVPVEEWLSTIKNAEYVITDSYHGSIFSIIFQRQFYTFINKKRGSDRFYSLFRKLNLQSRLIEKKIQIPDDNDGIDYYAVYEELKKLREESLSFLLSSLS